MPPADAIQFLNSKEKVSEKLSAHYVNFSFYYPKGWETDAKSAVVALEFVVALVMGERDGAVLTLHRLAARAA